MRLTGGKVFDLEKGFVTRDLCTDGSQISSQDGGGVTADLSGYSIIPGLVDVHFHGCVGEDFSDATPEGLQRMADYELSQGVTHICPAGMTLPEETVTRLGQALTFRYGHDAATRAPSKQTATQRKGRAKDEEVGDAAPAGREIHRTWRKPSFMEAQKRGKDYGNAIHGAMEYIHYDACGDAEGVVQELDRLLDQGFLTEEQRQMIKPEKIADFFASPLGQKLRSGTPYLREFKFSILDDGRHYDPDLEGEEVLLQGVVDCALLEEDGITIIDFKTDYVTAETLDALTDRYRIQVQTYADALSRIYQKPIKAAYLYLFALNRFVQM